MKTGVSGGLHAGAPVLFCLHGYPGLGAHWRQFSEHLGPDFDIFCPDMPWVRGAADPDRAKTVDLQKTLQRLGQWLAQRKGQPLHIVSHDLGGALGWWLAALVPQSVASLTVVAALHPQAYREYFKEFSGSGRRDYANRLAREPLDAPLNETSALTHAPEDPKAREDLLDGLSRTDPRAIRSVYRRSLSETAVHNAAEMPPIFCPVSVVYGTNDPYFPAASFDRSVALAGPRATASPIRDAGHFLPLTHARTLATLTRKTIDSAKTVPR